MTILINLKEYKLKYTIRGLFIYEQLTGTTFNPEQLLNEYTLMYAILIASNEGFNLDFKEFINCCDDNASIFLAFRKWLISELKQQTLLLDEEREADDSKKKD